MRHALASKILENKHKRPSNLRAIQRVCQRRSVRVLICEQKPPHCKDFRDLGVRVGYGADLGKLLRVAPEGRTISEFKKLLDSRVVVVRAIFWLGGHGLRAG